MQKKKKNGTSFERAHIAIPARSKEEFEELISEDKEMPTAPKLQKQNVAFMKEAKSMAHLLTKLKKITGNKKGK